MKLSELIEKAQRVMDSHGDLEVVTADSVGETVYIMGADYVDWIDVHDGGAFYIVSDM